MAEFLILSEQEYILDRIYADPNTGCWLWSLYTNKAGYGTCRWGPGSRRTQTAYRRSYRAFRGEIPDGLYLLHKCDNPICCNPDHLEPGTQAENIRQAVDRKRMARGERHYATKFTAADVRAIRSDRRSLGEVAREYGVGKTTICAIQKRANWGHIE